MVSGNHPTCGRQDIMMDMKQKGFNIINVVYIIKKEKNEDEQDNLVISRKWHSFLNSVVRKRQCFSEHTINSQFLTQKLKSNYFGKPQITYCSAKQGSTTHKSIALKKQIVPNVLTNILPETVQ